MEFGQCAAVGVVAGSRGVDTGQEPGMAICFEGDLGAASAVGYGQGFTQSFCVARRVEFPGQQISAAPAEHTERSGARSFWSPYALVSQCRQGAVPAESDVRPSFDLCAAVVSPNVLTRHVVEDACIDLCDIPGHHQFGRDLHAFRIFKTANELCVRGHCTQERNALLDARERELWDVGHV